MSKYLELVEGSFNESHYSKQKNQKPYVAYSIQDGKVIYTKMYTMYRAKSKDISNCTYNMVDLGLPSGRKWADRNVGASSPEDYGSYFQWGDTNAYTFDEVGKVTAAKLAEILNTKLGPELGMEITVDNVGMILEQSGVVSTDLTNTPIGSLGYSDKIFNWETYNEIDEIISYDEYGEPNEFKKYSQDKLTILESSDDAAAVHMGSNYRMPTCTEIRELINNTTQTFIDLDENEYSKEQAQNGFISREKLKGIRFTGSNGNSIFMPAANRIEIISFFKNAGWGCYLGNDLYSSNRCEGLYFNFDGEVYQGADPRYYPMSIRGVQA